MINWKARALDLVGWTLALVAAIVPGLIALDSGGVLPWAKWLAVTIAIALLIGCLCWRLLVSEERQGNRSTIVTAVLLGLGLVALLQSVSFPALLVGWLSPGVDQAWESWLNPLLPSGTAEQGPALSVAPGISRNAAALFFVSAAFFWVGANCCSESRERLQWILLGITFIGVIHAFLGTWQLATSPNQTIWGASASGPFGVFVNRNNSGAILLACLGASIGVFGWRMTTITGQLIGKQKIEYSTILDLFSDRVAVVSVLSAVVLFLSIVLSGSRGALGGAIVGIAIGLGIFRSGVSIKSWFSYFLLLLAVGCVLFLRLDLTIAAIDSFGSVGHGAAESVLSNQRLEHWQDSWRAMLHYLPFGAGWGTYRFAYLPYQQSGAVGWFVHADNLWLESLVEGGVLALLAALALATHFIRSAATLRESLDPLDQGLALSGWFILGALFTSQLFDFGLSLHPAAALNCLLLGVLVGRAEMHAPNKVRSTGQSRKLIFAKRPRDRAILLVPIILLVCLIYSEREMNTAAVSDAAQRTALLLARDGSKSDRNKAIEIATISVEENSSDYGSLVGLARLHHRRIGVTIEEILKTNKLLPMKTDFPVERYLIFFGMMERRTVVNPTVTEAEKEKWLSVKQQIKREVSTDANACAQYAILALKKAPLAIEPRFFLLEADVVGAESSKDELLCSQLRQLVGNADNTLSTLGDLAAIRGDSEQAIEIWRMVLEQRPETVSLYLRFATELNIENVQRLIPDQNSTAWESAARYMLEQPILDEEMAETCIDRLTGEQPEDRYARSMRYELLALLLDRMGKKEQAEDYFQKALATNPTRLQLHFEYINFLTRQGKLLQAISYCQSCEQRMQIYSEQFLSKRKQLEATRDDRLKSDINPTRSLTPTP